MSISYRNNGIFAMYRYGMYLDEYELPEMLDKMSESSGKRILASDLCDWDINWFVALLDHRHLSWWRVVRIYDRDFDKLGYEIPGAFLFALKGGSIFDGAGDTYRTPDELADEMREKYGKYLPDGFDYAAHFAVMICGQMHE